MRTDSVQFPKWVAHPSYKGFKTIQETLDENDYRVRLPQDKQFNVSLIVIERGQKEITLNKAIFIGVSVLDLSKVCMQNFWYNYIRELYPTASLKYTDTDSFIYCIESKEEPNFHGRNELQPDGTTKMSMFDTSDLPKNHPHYSEDNKKVPGMFKPENKHVPIAEMIALRAKVYALVLDELAYKLAADKDIKQQVKKCAGLSSSVVKKDVKAADYKNVLFTGISMEHQQLNFKSVQHQIHTIKSVKNSLSAFDSKRFILPDGINTLPYGHKDIKNYQ
jgi:hypothetical protein